MKIMKFSRQYRIFLFSMLLFAVGSALYQGVFENYLANILNVSKSGRGMIEFFREMPGLLLFVILALLYRFTDNRILVLGYAIALVGVLGVMLSSSSLVVSILFITVLSAGQHILMPVRQSIVVHSVAPGREGAALGFMQSIISVGRVAGFLIVPLIFSLFEGNSGTSIISAAGSDRIVPEGFRVTFYLVAGLMVLAVVCSLFLKNSKGSIERQRIYFHRKYRKYYVLQSFYGARKQVFLTFGPYVLILMYGATPSVIATILGICAAISIVTTPLLGRIIDKIGYKAVMVGDTIVLFIVCLVYGFSHRLFPEQTAFYMVCGVFVLDSLVSHASIAASIYVKDLSSGRDEVTATLTTGLSIDHLISVFIALIGGIVWETFGVELLFSIAAVMAVINSLVALTIRPPAANGGQPAKTR